MSFILEFLLQCNEKLNESYYENEFHFEGKDEYLQIKEIYAKAVATRTIPNVTEADKNFYLGWKNLIESKFEDSIQCFQFAAAAGHPSASTNKNILLNRIAKT